MDQKELLPQPTGPETPLVPHPDVADFANAVGFEDHQVQSMLNEIEVQKGIPSEGKSASPDTQGTLDHTQFEAPQDHIKGADPFVPTTSYPQADASHSFNSGIAITLKSLGTAVFSRFRFSVSFENLESTSQRFIGRADARDFQEQMGHP